MSTAQELVALRTFLAVYRAGGVTKAAEALHMSQPAVSHHLRTVESAAERPLFVRSGRGIAATEAGHALAARIAAHVDALDAALDSVRPSSIAALSPVFLGGPADQLDGYVLPALAPLMDEGLVVRCRTGLSADLVAALLANELDVAVVTKIEGLPTKQLHLVHGDEEGFVLIGRSGQEPYAPGRGDRRFAGYSEDMPMARRYFRECWGLTPPEPAVTVPDMRAVVSLVASSSLISVVPRYLAQGRLRSGELVVLHDPETPVLNPIYFATRRGRQHLPHIAAVFDRFQTLSANRDDRG